MIAFLASLARDDLAPATLRGYRYDLRHFLAWHCTVQDSPFTIEGLAEYELIAYRQHMVAAGRANWRPSIAGWMRCAGCADGRKALALSRSTPRGMSGPCARCANNSPWV